MTVTDPDTTAEAAIAAALHDPGQYVERAGVFEPFSCWQARAATAALRRHGIVWCAEGEIRASQHRLIDLGFELTDVKADLAECQAAIERSHRWVYGVGVALGAASTVAAMAALLTRW